MSFVNTITAALLNGAVDEESVIDELERIVQKEKRDFMKITYTSILSAICSSILLLVFLSVYIWKKQENYSLYEVKLLIFCTVLTGVRLFFPIDICGISHYDRNKNIISRTLSLYAGENRIFKSFFCTFFD